MTAEHRAELVRYLALGVTVRLAVRYVRLDHTATLPRELVAPLDGYETENPE